MGSGVDDADVEGDEESQARVGRFLLPRGPGSRLGLHAG
jgi:hypothetical protein